MAKKKNNPRPAPRPVTQRVTRSMARSMRQTIKAVTRVTTAVRQAFRHMQSRTIGSVTTSLRPGASNTASISNSRRIICLDAEMGPTMDIPQRQLPTQVAVLNGDSTILYNEIIRQDTVLPNYYTVRFTEDEMKKAVSFDDARETVKALLQNSILVGHDVASDLRAFQLQHEERFVRDTSTYPGFLKYRTNEGNHVKLAVLAKELLNRTIQKKYHSPLEDAQCTLDLYHMVSREWEEYLKQRRKDDNDGGGSSPSAA